MIPFSLLLILEYSIGAKSIEILQDGNIENKLTKKNFFSSNFPEQQTIFLLGSSHMGIINVTRVNDMMVDDNITVYNLAEPGNSPSVRIKQLEQIISAKPEIVFYGLSYRDFQFPYQMM